MTKKKKPTIYFYLLTLIVLIGAVIRTVGIVNPETGFYVDEAALGYNAKSLIETGTDEYGQSLPLAFRSFGDFKSPLFIYSAIPLVKLLGIPLGVRLTAAIWGVLTIWWTAEISRTILKKEKKKTACVAGLVTAVVLALSPWHVNLSRHAIEAVMATALWSLGLLLLVRKKYSTAIISLSLSALTYHSTKYAVPLLFLILAGFYLTKNKRLKIKGVDKFSLIAGLFALLVIVINLQGFSNARAGGVALLGVNGWWKTIRDMAASYLAYFSPRVLNLGDWQVRNSVYGIDNVPLLVIIFFFFGLWTTGRKWFKTKQLNYLIVLLALLLSPLPASATIDPFHSIRSLIMLVPLAVLAGLGLAELAKKLNKNCFKLLSVLMVCFSLWQMIFLSERLWVQNTIVGYDDWAWGYEQVIEKVKEIEPEEYEKIYIDTTDASAAYSLWMVFAGVKTEDKIPYENGYYDPVKWQSPKKLVIEGNKTIYFKEVYWPTDQLMKNTLFVGSYRRFHDSALKEAEAKVVEEIKDKTGKTWWMIVATK